MRIARIAARIFLALLFIGLGALSFKAPPPVPGMAGEFDDLLYRSHWGEIVGVAQIFLGILLLINRYVPVALIILAAFLYNSVAYHLTTSPQFLAVPLVCAALGVFVGWPYRRAFAQLFTARAEE